VILGGSAGGLAALGGLAVGFAALIPFYALGGLGAGDVKLMATAGSLLGSPLISAHAVLYTVAAGGLFSLVYWIMKEGWQVALAEALHLLRHRRGPGVAASGLRMPYALAITVGSLTAALTTPLIGG
jgi:prepilin peptidase CpaA